MARRIARTADIRQQSTMNFSCERAVVFTGGQVSHIDSMRDPYDLEINCRSQLTIRSVPLSQSRVKACYTRRLRNPDNLPVSENQLVRPRTSTDQQRLASTIISPTTTCWRACSLRLRVYAHGNLSSTPTGFHRLVHPSRRRTNHPHLRRRAQLRDFVSTTRPTRSCAAGAMDE